MSEPVRIDEDARYALAAGALAAERRNRPRWMVQAAALLLAIAGVALIIGLSSKQAADRAARDAATAVGEVSRAVAELDRLKAQGDEGGPVLVGDRLPTLLSTMESLARRAGIEERLPTPRERAGDTATGAIAKRYEYTLTGPELDRLLRFVDLARSQIDAMQVYSLRLRIVRTREARDAWEMNVVFQRWERTQG